MDCPKCGHTAAFGALECERCGVIFSRASHSRAPMPRPYVIEEERIGDGRIGPSERKILGVGLLAAIVVYALPFTRFVFSAIVTLFHEFGHAAAGWLFGYASIPAFDFVYGGGMTHHGPFRLSIAVAVACGFAYLVWLFRENKKSVAIVAVIFLVWLFFVTKEWRREIAFASAGHLAEFILAGILFYKALAGVGWRAPGFERPLGAFVAFFVQIHSTLFAWRLIHDQEFLEWYRRGKGGALMNDLEVVALDVQIRLGYAPQIEGVAKMLLVFSVLPTIIALVWYLERARWHRVLRALRTADA
ncbi:MAG TPA: hypothetical protein VGQ36_11510 [Thermoanaerobaculia bacterium]|jgi:hypothetical protein|nr:hypothetical protein [Thermoanaerobaculia bacterium]